MHETIHQVSKDIKKDGTKKRNRPGVLLCHQMHQRSSLFENNTVIPKLQESRILQTKKTPKYGSVEEQSSAVSIEITRRSSTKEDLELLTHKEECEHNSEPSQPTTSKAKNQTTLLAFKKPTEATVPTPMTPR